MKKSIAVLLLVLLFGQSAADNSCGNNPASQELAHAIIEHNKQQRPQLQCNQKLSKIALIKAHLLAKELDISHNAGHTTPNHLLRKNGYDLSKRYPVLGNQVEAIAGGEPDTEVAFQDFLNSEPHRILLLGEHPYFTEQNDIGVAYLYNKNTPYEHYWVVLFGDQDKASTAVNIHKEFMLSPIKK
ncbi:CAP domain-containing protein [Marinicella rhabdoformis]|uniref:CAP domain-containing protein n=1 Tax=Marinicella rhabdoformis TaxID=2580566 RepID=UPI0012AEBB28|nr:CAP domain-containing protein [Marinicella rhabdoformis]